MNPMRFDRVGYPLTVADIDSSLSWSPTPLAKERNIILDRLVRAFVEPSLSKHDSFVLSISTTQSPSIDSQIETHLRSAANLAVLMDHNFGGDNREIYEHNFSKDTFDEANDNESDLWLVMRKRSIRTGVRHKGWSSYSPGNDQDYDGEGPRLHDQVTHCVYSLRGQSASKRYVWLVTLATNTERLEGAK